MANRWSDGLARYGGNKSFMLNGSSSQAWAQVDSSLSLSTANPRTGTHSLRISVSSSQNIARRVFGDPLTEVFCGVAVYADSLPQAETITGLLGEVNGFCLGDLRDQSNASQCSLWLGTDGAIEARRRSTVLGRSSPVIGAGAYQHLEFYALADNSAGAIEVRVDEVTVLNLTGIDTVSTSNIEFSQWAFGHANASSGDYTFVDFADFYLNDTTDDGSGCDTWIGDCKVGTRMVDADTAQADFALSAGSSGYALIDGQPPDDATFLSTDASTAQSDFGIEDGPTNTSEILTVRPFVRAWKDDAGTANIAPSMISAGDKAAVSAQPIAIAPAYYDSNVPLNPDTGAPWTPAELNAALAVVERTA